MDQELLEAPGQCDLCVLVTPVTSAGHSYLALEFPEHPVVRASGFPSVPFNVDISVQLAWVNVLVLFLTSFMRGLKVALMAVTSVKWAVLRKSQRYYPVVVFCLACTVIDQKPEVIFNRD